MTKIWAVFREWLIEVWDFVPREDYAYVQRDRQRLDEHVRHLISEQHELLESAYRSRFKPFEELADVPFEAVQINHVDVQQEEFRWSVRIPPRRFYTTYDIKGELDVMKRYVLERLAQVFKQHIGKQLFGKSTPLRNL